MCEKLSFSNFIITPDVEANLVCNVNMLNFLFDHFLMAKKNFENCLTCRRVI